MFTPEYLIRGAPNSNATLVLKLEWAHINDKYYLYVYTDLVQAECATDLTKRKKSYLKIHEDNYHSWISGKYEKYNMIHVNTRRIELIDLKEASKVYKIFYNPSENTGRDKDKLKWVQARHLDKLIERDPTEIP